VINQDLVEVRSYYFSLQRGKVIPLLFFLPPPSSFRLRDTPSPYLSEGVKYPSLLLPLTAKVIDVPSIVSPSGGSPSPLFPSVVGGRRRDSRLRDTQVPYILFKRLGGSREGCAVINSSPWVQFSLSLLIPLPPLDRRGPRLLNSFLYIFLLRCCF